MGKIRHMPFQLDRPVFARIPFTARGVKVGKGKELKWKELNLDSDRIQHLYNQGYLIHDVVKEKAASVGDGLDYLDVETLNGIAKEYDDRVKEVANNKSVHASRRPKQSKVKDKQIGIIRSWRRNQLPWLEQAEEDRKARRQKSPAARKADAAAEATGAYSEPQYDSSGSDGAENEE